MSTSPEAPPQILFAGLSAEELIAAEQGHRADPEPSILGKRPSQTREGDSDDEEYRSPSPEDRDNSGDSNPSDHANVSTLRTEQAVRRLRKRLKLSNNDTALIGQFAQEDSIDIRLMILYGSVITIGRELAEVRQSLGTASYQIGDELMDNIKKYARLTLLSPSIFHYKGSVPKDYLVKLVLKYRFGIPANIEANGHAWGKITTCIDYELTQARADNQLKKDTKIEDVQSRSTIYQLARAMVGDENYKISPAICTRVAIMREVYLSFPGGDFWDQVDKTLNSIKPMPEGTSYLRAILSRDRRTYGVAPGTIATAPDSATADGDEPLMQQRIEDLIVAPGGSTDFRPPVI